MFGSSLPPESSLVGRLLNQSLKVGSLDTPLCKDNSQRLWNNIIEFVWLLGHELYKNNLFSCFSKYSSPFTTYESHPRLVSPERVGPVSYSWDTTSVIPRDTQELVLLGYRIRHKVLLTLQSEVSRLVQSTLTLSILPNWHRSLLVTRDLCTSP